MDFKDFQGEYLPNPFEQKTVQEDTHVYDRLAGLKKPLVLALLVIMAANAIIMVLAGGYIKFEPRERKQKTEETVTTTLAPVLDTGTAYSHVIPATGAYAAGIDRYINYERSQMKQDEVVFSFTGDCTLGTWPESSKETCYNTIHKLSGSDTYSFDLVKSFFENDDYTYVNLETTLTKSTARLSKPESSYNFKGDPEWAETMLKASSIEGCNLANNHSYDYKSKGYNETQNVLLNAGINVGMQNSAIFVNIKGLEIVLISANFITTSYNPDEIFGDDLTAFVVKEIEQFKRDGNIVIVNCHWGLERQNNANEEQTVPAHKFIDAGADMVIGHHPHTLQGVENYRGKYIFYSIGNFAFGGKATTDEVNRVSIIVRPRFALREGQAIVTGICIVPCYTTSAVDLEENNYQPMPVFGLAASQLYNEIIQYSGKLASGVTSLSCPAIDFEEIITTPTTFTTTTVSTETSETTTTSSETTTTTAAEETATTTTAAETTTTTTTTATTSTTASTTAAAA